LPRKSASESDLAATKLAFPERTTVSQAVTEMQAPKKMGCLKLKSDNLKSDSALRGCHLWQEMEHSPIESGQQPAMRGLLYCSSQNF